MIVDAIQKTCLGIKVNSHRLMQAASNINIVDRERALAVFISIVNILCTKLEIINWEKEGICKQKWEHNSITLTVLEWWISTRISALATVEYSIFSGTINLSIFAFHSFNICLN